MNLILSIKNLKESGIEAKLADVLFKNEKEEIKHLFNYLFYYLPKQKFIKNGVVIEPYLYNKILKQEEEEEYLQLCCELALTFKREVSCANEKDLQAIFKKVGNVSKKRCYKELNFKKQADFDAFQKLEEKKDLLPDLEFENLLTSIELNELIKVLTKKQKEALLKKLKYGGKLHSDFKKRIQEKAKPILK